MPWYYFILTSDNSLLEKCNPLSTSEKYHPSWLVNQMHKPYWLRFRSRRNNTIVPKLGNIRLRVNLVLMSYVPTYMYLLDEINVYTSIPSYNADYPEDSWHIHLNTTWLWIWRLINRLRNAWYLIVLVFFILLLVQKTEWAPLAKTVLTSTANTL